MSSASAEVFVMGRWPTEVDENVVSGVWRARPERHWNLIPTKCLARDVSRSDNWARFSVYGQSGTARERD